MNKRILLLRRSGMTRIEWLVVLSIMVILCAIIVLTLSGVMRASRVVAATDVLAAAFRRCRFIAMEQNTPTMPVILRHRGGQYSVVCAIKSLAFNGELKRADKPIITYLPVESCQSGGLWALTRPAQDLRQLQKGAFVFWVGRPSQELNGMANARDNCEMMFMRVKPNNHSTFEDDFAKRTYEILNRGVYNTAMCEFTQETPNAHAADVYMIVSDGQAENTLNDGKEEEQSAFSAVGVNLPDCMAIDKMIVADEQPEALAHDAITSASCDGRKQSVRGDCERDLRDNGKRESLTASSLCSKGEETLIFLPIFIPKGCLADETRRNASATIFQSSLQKTNCNSYSTSIGKQTAGVINACEQTVRVMDMITREARYVTIKSGGEGDSGGGEVVISAQLPSLRGLNGKKKWMVDSCGLLSSVNNRSASRSSAIGTPESSKFREEDIVIVISRNSPDTSNNLPNISGSTSGTSSSSTSSSSASGQSLGPTGTSDGGPGGGCAGSNVW